jgi:methylthioribose-1-phosphate isomerase
MMIENKPYTSLWYDESAKRVMYIDQTRLPHELSVREMKNLDDGIRAITDMEVRGAPLIGVAAAFAMYLAASRDQSSGPPPDIFSKSPFERMRERLEQAAERLVSTRPTAVNLKWAVDRMLKILSAEDPAPTAGSVPQLLLEEAQTIRRMELDNCLHIGREGLAVIRRLYERKRGKTVNILTHCNAGWLATVDYGTALAPVYLAHDAGIHVHVWVDETRPRNQGAKLTAYELTGHGVPNTLIVDNAGGLLMQQGKVDMVIVGADRIAGNGDVVNKVGTYLKALAAADNKIPFYVAAPASTFDPVTPAGSDVVIEERSPNEILFDDQGFPVAGPGTRVHNPAFDITPARLVTDFWR